MGIREELNATGDAAWVRVSEYLKHQYIGNAGEAARRREASLRAALYADGGNEFMRELLRRVFSDPGVRRDREVWIDHAKYDNALKRIINELSTVYAEPAARYVENATNPQFRELQKLVRQDHVMRRANRWVNLHNECLVWFRTRRATPGDDAREPVLEAIDPSHFYAVAHPTDRTRLIAIVLDQAPRGPHVRPEMAHYLVWTPSEVFNCDQSGTVMPETLQPNTYGLIPGVLIHREPPDMQLLDGTAGADMVSAHVAAWFVDVSLLKETRTVNKQVAFGGDLSTTPSGQPQDLGRDMHLGEGVTAQTIDRTIDLSQFRDTADHIIERAAANHGIPPSVLRHDSAASGFEIELRRIGLRERRRDQALIFRPAEAELAQVMATVVARDIPQLGFVPEPFVVDFGEVEVPRDPLALLAFREKARAMGLANTIEFLMADNPDLDAERALARLEANIGVELARNELMRPLSELNGSASQGVDDAQTPQENGDTARNPSEDG